jgi:hypothetical protein
MTARAAPAERPHPIGTGSTPSRRHHVDEERRADEAQEQETEDDGTPVGAIAVTSFLMVTILVLWFGMYVLNMARS